MRKKNFLNQVCPFRVLESEVTWGEFIRLQIMGFIGAAVLLGFYMIFVIVADIVGVVD